MTERLVLSDGEFEINRDQFGEGKAGDMAFAIVSEPSTSCKAIVDEEGRECSARARETFDFDIFGNLEMIPCCGGEHCSLIQSRVEEDLTKAGMFSAFGRNGFGRSYDKSVLLESVNLATSPASTSSSMIEPVTS